MDCKTLCLKLFCHRYRMRHSHLIKTSVLTRASTSPTITQSNDTLFSSAASSYQWYQDGNLVSGATNSFYVAPTSGLYTVVITDANGCTASDEVNIELYQQPTAIIVPLVTKICPDSCIGFN